MIKEYLLEHIEVTKSVMALEEEIQKATQICLEALRNGNKILIFGNGGSAADAQHIAAEFVGRYKKERISLPAIALTTDTSAITAIGNDYGYEYVFSRQVEGLAVDGDVLIGISTSGNSENVYKAFETEKNVQKISLLGKSGGTIKDISDLSIIIPSNNTPRIQEMHITIGHIICELIDNEEF
jgi:D-sedoheptulose 7-phosphate isomerase